VKFGYIKILKPEDSLEGQEHEVNAVKACDKEAFKMLVGEKHLEVKRKGDDVSFDQEFFSLPDVDQDKSETLSVTVGDLDRMNQHAWNCSLVVNTPAYCEKNAVMFPPSVIVPTPSELSHGQTSLVVVLTRIRVATFIWTTLPDVR